MARSLLNGDLDLLVGTPRAWRPGTLVACAIVGGKSVGAWAEHGREREISN